MALSILNKIFIKEEKKRNFFLALEITPNIIKAACCEIESEKIGILGTASSEYDGLWENAIVAADKIIAKVEENLPLKINLGKAILGLPEEFIKEGKIGEEYLPKIKELCQKLLLEPLGFVEIPLAIVNFLKKQEGGTPESLVLLRLGPKLEVVLVRVGKITNNTTILSSGNLATDLEIALQSFTEVEVLPSKILVFDGMNLETAKQELMNHPWTSRAPFLHFPKIEAAPLDLDIKSVAYAGAGEMMNNLEIIMEEKTEEPVIKEPLTEEGENFSSVKDAEILGKPQQVLVTEEIKQGFSKIKFNLPNFTLPEFNLPPFSFPKIPKMGIILVVVLFVIMVTAGLASAFWYWPTAKVNLFLRTKTLQQQPEITLDSKLKWEIDETLTKKAVATGKKLVGEKAKGTVTIYNKTTNSKIFKKETVLTGPNNLKFLFDNDVTVASVSGDITQPVSGKSDVTVVASDIGPAGNLGAGQIFQFGDYSSNLYVARNNAAFSGGSSREISVISRDDRDNLLTLVQAQLSEKAKKDLSLKLGNGENFLEETLTSEVTRKKFDKEINQEGTELNLDLTLRFSVLGYQEEDLISGSTPQGYEISKDSLKVEVVDLQKNKDGTYKLKANLEVSFLPKINNPEIKKNLVGKNLKEVDGYLRSLGNIGGYQINFQRTFFLSKNILPYSSENILIETSPLK